MARAASPVLSGALGLFRRHKNPRMARHGDLGGQVGSSERLDDIFFSFPMVWEKILQNVETQDNNQYSA
jgi:hypothetical protein